MVVVGSAEAGWLALPSKEMPAAAVEVESLEEGHWLTGTKQNLQNLMHENFK